MPRSLLLDKFKTAMPHCIRVSEPSRTAGPARGPVAGAPGSDSETEIVAYFSSVEEEYWALKKSVGLVDLSHRGRILIRGEDAARFLHGMVTNEVNGLPVGKGNYAFLLNVQGHIIADARILRLDEKTFLLDCEPQSHETIWQQLDRHIIADDVELVDQREELACIAVEGPLARDVLSRAVGGELPGPAAWTRLYRDDLQARIVESSLSGNQGFWIFAAPQKAGDIVDKIFQLGADIVKPVGFDALETCRIEAGIPRYGVDISDKNLLQETAQMHAVSFTKGCYVGQEVVERVRSRGHVNRKLVHLLVEGRQKIAPETPITVDGEPVGSTGSSAYCFDTRKTLAFGYVRREEAEAGKQLRIGAFTATIAEPPTNARSAGGLE